MQPEPKVVLAPDEGFWRVGRISDPLAIRLPDPATLASPTAGNRFDSPDASYGVLYFGTSREVCFREILARFRPEPSLAALVKDEWQQLGWMEVGSLSREWREARGIVRVSPEPMPFLDLEHPETLEHLRYELSLGLSALGVQDLDVSTVRGPDRRVTRLISDWAIHADLEAGPLGGIRYKSRLATDQDCWAVFGDVDLEQIEAAPLAKEDVDLRTVARQYSLTVH